MRSRAHRVGTAADAHASGSAAGPGGDLHGDSASADDLRLGHGPVDSGRLGTGAVEDQLAILVGESARADALGLLELVDLIPVRLGLEIELAVVPAELHRWSTAVTWVPIAIWG